MQEQLRGWAPAYRREAWRRALAGHGVSDGALAEQFAAAFVRERRPRTVCYNGMAEQMDILLTWVGDRDAEWVEPASGRRQPGPILTLLQERRFDVLYLLFTLHSAIGNFRARATRLLRICQRRWPQMQVHQHPVDLVDVTDYREVYRVTQAACRRILDGEGRDGRRYFVYLQPGTGQMQTVWVLLVQSGLLPARLLATVRPDLRSRWQPPWREVDLSLAELPQIVSPDEMTQRIGVLQAQNTNLRAAVQRLEAQVAVLGSVAGRAGLTGRAGGTFPPGFSLRTHLLTEERLAFVRALEATNGKAAAAARLLGVEPAAFRARAQTLGVRPRQRRQVREP